MATTDNNNNNFGDADLPMGLGCPRNHPKKQQLTHLIAEYAPEYARAPQSTGFFSKADRGRFIRPKTEIITKVIHELMQDGGRYMIKDKKLGRWIVREGFDEHTKQVRNMIQERFNKLIKTWNGRLLPLPLLFKPEQQVLPPRLPLIIPPQQPVLQGENNQLENDRAHSSEAANSCVVEPPAKNANENAGGIDEAPKKGEDEEAKPSSHRGKKSSPNIFLACNGATTWNELLNTPILPNELRLSEVARSFAYLTDRRLVVNAKNKSGSKISVYKCQTCAWTVKFIKRRGAVAKRDPWYLDSWGVSGGSKQHGGSCEPVGVLRQGDILRNSIQLRDYLADHRQANRDEIEVFMRTKGIDVSQMGNGSFYDARNHILCLLEMNDASLLSSQVVGGNASVVDGGDSAATNTDLPEDDQASSSLTISEEYQAARNLLLLTEPTQDASNESFPIGTTEPNQVAPDGSVEELDHLEENKKRGRPGIMIEGPPSKKARSMTSRLAALAAYIIPSAKPPHTD